MPKLRRSARALAVRGDRIIMGGCGDSYYSAIAVSGIFGLCGVPFVPKTSLEIEQFCALGASDLVVLASVSGTTQRTLKAAKKATKQGARTLAITCDPRSALADVCDETLLLPYRPMSRRTPHTLDYMVTLLAQVVVLEHWARTHVQVLDDLPGLLQTTIERTARVVNKLSQVQGQGAGYFFLGAGEHMGTAMYGSAKFHEAGGLFAAFSEAENFWHGMNFTVQQGSWITVFGNGREQPEVEQLLVATLAELTPNLLYVGSGMVDAPYQVVPPATDEVTTPFVYAIAPQILCHSAATRLGLRTNASPARGGALEPQQRAQASWLTQHVPAAQKGAVGGSTANARRAQLETEVSDCLDE